MECKEGGFIFQRCGHGGCGLVVAAGGWSCSSGRGSLRVAPHRGGSDADSDSGTQSVAAAGRGQVSSAVRSQ